MGHVAKTWCYRSNRTPLGDGRGTVGVYERVRALAFHVKYEVNDEPDENMQPTDALTPLNGREATVFIYENPQGAFGYGFRTDVGTHRATDDAPKELHCDGIVDYPLQTDRKFGLRHRSKKEAAAGLARSAARDVRALLFPKTHTLVSAGKRVTTLLYDFIDKRPDLGREGMTWLEGTTNEERTFIRSKSEYQNGRSRRKYQEENIQTDGIDDWFSEFLNAWNETKLHGLRTDFSLLDDVVRSILGTEVLRRYMKLRQGAALFTAHGFPPDLSLVRFFLDLRAAELSAGDVRMAHFVNQLKRRPVDDTKIPQNLKSFLCVLGLTVYARGEEVTLLDKRLRQYYCEGKIVQNGKESQREAIEVLKPHQGRPPRNEIRPMIHMVASGRAKDETRYPDNIRKLFPEERGSTENGSRTVYIPEVNGTYGTLTVTGWSQFSCEGGRGSLGTYMLKVSAKRKTVWILAQAVTTADHPRKPWETHVDVHSEAPSSDTKCPTEKGKYVLKHETDESLNQAVNGISSMLSLPLRGAEKNAVAGALSVVHGRGVPDLITPTKLVPEPIELPDEAPRLTEPELSITSVKVNLCWTSWAALAAEQRAVVKLSGAGWEHAWYVSADYSVLRMRSCANLETTESADGLCACWAASDVNRAEWTSEQDRADVLTPLRNRLLQQMSVYYLDTISKGHVDEVDKMFERLVGWDPSIGEKQD